MTQQANFFSPTTLSPVSTYASFGSDLAGTTDLFADMRETSGLALLGDALYRRLITPRGRLLDDPNYGYDLTQWINADVDASDIDQMQQNIRAECLKDQRVLSATATTNLTNADVLVITIAVTTALGPFSLVLAVSAVGVTVLSTVST